LRNSCYGCGRLVEWVGVLVSTVGILLQRIFDRERNIEKRIDVKDALMDLLHIVRKWERLAKQTNKALLEWVDNDKIAEEFEYRQRLRELGRLQSLEVQDAVNALGLTEESPPYMQRNIASTLKRPPWSI
jgi:hypothetical protein